MCDFIHTMLKRLFGHSHEPARCCRDEECERQRLDEADRRLHDQATRLHVLEWEAYGHPKQHREREQG